MLCAGTWSPCHPGRSQSLPPSAARSLTSPRLGCSLLTKRKVKPTTDAAMEEPFAIMHGKHGWGKAIGKPPSSPSDTQAHEHICFFVFDFTGRTGRAGQGRVPFSSWMLGLEPPDPLPWKRRHRLLRECNKVVAHRWTSLVVCR